MKKWEKWLRKNTISWKKVEHNLIVWLRDTLFRLMIWRNWMIKYQRAIVIVKKSTLRLMLSWMSEQIVILRFWNLKLNGYNQNVQRILKSNENLLSNNQTTSIFEYEIYSKSLIYETLNCESSSPYIYEWKCRMSVKLRIWHLKSICWGEVLTPDKTKWSEKRRNWWMK